jgi:hypothetical protein
VSDPIRRTDPAAPASAATPTGSAPDPRVGAVLAELADRLDLPQPARTRVLLELAADLEELHRAHLAEGLPEPEAFHRAVETIDLSDEALRGLARVHATGLHRFLDTLSERGRAPVERLLLALTFLVIAGAVVLPLTGGRLLADAGPLAAPVVLGAGIATALAVRKGWSLFVLRRHGLREVRRGVLPVLGIALAVLFTGGVVGLSDLFLTVAGVSVFPGRAAGLLGPWLLRSAALAILTLSSTIGLATLWFVLEGKVARIERAELEWRLGFHPPTRRE